LESLFVPQIPAMTAAFLVHDYIELTRIVLVIHV
jgi:hypothetical protein